METEQGELVIASEDDIVTARTTIRDVASELRFGMTDVTRIVTAVSELARNVHLYADTGVMRWQRITKEGRMALEITFDDDGPGIQDVDKALREGYSTSNSMGNGLSGTRTLMDEFEIESEIDHGTTIVIRKYLPA